MRYGFSGTAYARRYTVTIHFAYYYLCCIYQTLVTLAMEADLANHVWSKEEFIGLLDREQSEGSVKYRFAAWAIVGFLVAGWIATTSKAICMVIMVLGFAVCGWLGVFKTNMLVAMGRKNYEKSKFLRSSPL